MPAHSSTNITIGTETRKLYFRNQSSDETIIRDVLVNQVQYNLNHLRRVHDLLNFVKQRQKAGLRPLVIDAGANIGAASIYFLANLPTALVIAIEPNRENFELLVKNTQGLQVEPIHGALSSTRGRMQVADPGEGHWGYRAEKIKDEETANEIVTCVTLNDLYGQYSSGYFPFIVKVDIEGGEVDLFSGGTQWIAQTPLLIVELHDWLLPKQGISLPFLKCISALNRDFVCIGQEIYSIANNLGDIAEGVG